MTYAGEVFGELTFTALFGQLWALPFLIFINVIDINSINKWIAWAVMTALLCYPNGKLQYIARPISHLLSSTSIFYLIPVQEPAIVNLTSCSSSLASWLDIPKFQHRPLPHRLGSAVQHVSPNIRHYLLQHLSRGRCSTVQTGQSQFTTRFDNKHLLVSGHKGILREEEPRQGENLEQNERRRTIEICHGDYGRRE